MLQHDRTTTFFGLAINFSTSCQGSKVDLISFEFIATTVAGRQCIATIRKLSHHNAVSGLAITVAKLQFL